MSRRNTRLFLIGCFVSLFACSPPSNDSNGESETQAEPEEVAVQSDKMVLVGDISNVYTNGRLVVFSPEKATSTAMTATSTTTTSNGDSTEQKRPSVTDGLNVLGEAPILDGKFSLEIQTNEPQHVYFYVLDAINEDGIRLAPVKGQQFILEPGNLEMTMSTSSRFVIHGGKYNDAVFNSWKTSSSYIAANEEYRSLLQTVEGETEQERRDRVDAASAKYSEILDIETQGRKLRSFSDPDPVVRKLIIQTTWLGGDWILESVHRLARMTPDDPWAINKRDQLDEAWRKREEQKKIAVGTQIIDFSAETLEGETFALSDFQAESDVILLEFWASWCGPCRAEIPHMKQAYDRFNGKGFEIVGFTIDDDYEDWEVASVEEELPWPNLGMGSDSDSATTYRITGVPKNFLLDSKTGTILAVDLRQHHLDEFLEKLL